MLRVVSGGDKIASIMIVNGLVEGVYVLFKIEEAGIIYHRCSFNSNTFYSTHYIEFRYFQ